MTVPSATFPQTVSWSAVWIRWWQDGILSMRPAPTPSLINRWRSICPTLPAWGATPYAILVGLSLPKSMANDDFCQAFAGGGLAAACTPFGIELIGGDTTSSPILTISVTALGFVPHGQAITRQGACVGDVVCVSGTVGLASLALHGILDDLHGDGHANRPPKSLPEKITPSHAIPRPTSGTWQAAHRLCK